MIVIAGTSGVGKSYLEQHLVENEGFFQPTKYTTRPLRTGEAQGKYIVSVDEKKFALMKQSDKLGFYLEFDGAYHGWRKEEINRKDTDIVVAITLRDLERFCNRFSNFIPIILYFTEKRKTLIINRMRSRAQYESKTLEEKHRIDQTIQKRMEIALEDTSNIEKYISIAKKHNGRVFEIIDNSTLYKKVLPFISDLS